jgi:signal transduction histidine kinase/DNA-binding NarL/FixJ family response regulator
MIPARVASIYGRSRARVAALRPWTVGLAMGLLAFCLVGTGSAWFLARDRGELLSRSSANLASSSVIGANFVERTIGTLDVVVSIGLEAYASGELSLDDLGGWLSKRAPGAEQLKALNDHAIAGHDGRIIYAANPGAIGVNVADRPYFTVHRDGKAQGIYIGKPVRSRAAPHRRIVPLSWALRDSRGEFIGVVTVVASWRLYAEVFDRLRTDPDQLVGLLEPEGRVYALDLHHWGDTETEPYHPHFLERLGALPADQPKVQIIGDEIVAQAQVKGFHLRVFTSLPIATVLRPWWMLCYLISGATLAISLGTGLLFGLLQRHFHALRLMVASARTAQERAEAGERAKAQFLAAMSHEIRTPMTGVLGMADLLSAESLEPRQRGYVQAIRTSGRHLLSVINDVLDFSRADADGLVLEHVDFASAQMMEQIRSIMAPQARDRGLTLEFQIDGSVPGTLHGDPTRLRQILVNLIGNGLKFTSQGGVVVGWTCTSEGAGQCRCRLEVRDTGIGIPVERRADLFQAFTQVDLSTTRKYGGSGLGLAICRQLVEAMGGRIGIESEPGKGSLFWFEVTLEESDAPVSEAVAGEVDAIRPLRILVAEDVEINRDLLRAMLGRDGHHVTMVENGQEAVAAVAAQPFDVVLMDMQMPMMDGIEATRRIRTLPTPTGQVPIVALTANVMESEREHCLQAGMDRVLTKPIDWPELSRMLSELAVEAPAATASAGFPEKPQVLMAEPEPRASDLLDRSRIEDLGKITGRDRLQGFLRSALASAENLLAEMTAHRDDQAEIVKIAHRLAGTAPSVGLARIGAIAREIEHRALGGGPIEPSLDVLQEALAATRAELERSGLLTSS